MHKTIVHQEKMPLITWLLLIVATLIAGCSGSDKENNASVRVKVKGSIGEMIYLEKITLDGPVLVDSGKLDQQGELTFRMILQDFEFFFLHDRQGKKIMLVIEKDEAAEVFTAREKFGLDYTVQGSGGSILLHELEDRKALTLAKLDSLGQVWYKERYSEDNLQIKEVFDSIGEVIIAEHKSYLTTFLNKYPESPASLIAIYQVLISGNPIFTLESDSAAFFNLATTLGNRYPQNGHVKDFVDRADDYREEIKAWQQREKMLAPGNPAPPVDLFNTAGEKVSLASFAGKTVLLYFWDARKEESWELNRQLVGLYKLYNRKGFEICGIYTGEDKQLLFNAVKIDGIPWTNLLGNSAIVKDYNVAEVPVMLLISAEGKVLKRTITLPELTTRLPWLLPQGSGQAYPPPKPD